MKDVTKKRLMNNTLLLRVIKRSTSMIEEIGCKLEQLQVLRLTCTDALQYDVTM